MSGVPALYVSGYLAPSEGTVGAATIDGTLYGIPTELSVYELFYNKKMLAEAGLSVRGVAVP